MKMYYVSCTNLSEDVNRQFLLRLFKPFGTIKKVYLHPEYLYSKVYFEEIKSAEEALSISGQPPHYLHLSLECENNPKRGTSFSSAKSANSKMSFEDEELYGEPGRPYYNIHGICVPTLIGDDGTIFVELNEVKKIGFELFEERNVPRIDFNEKRFDELKFHLAGKARKFLRNMGSIMPESEIQRATDETINDCVKNGLIRDISKHDRSSLSSSNTSHDTKSNNEPFRQKKNSAVDNLNRNNNNAKGAYPREKPNEPQKPLRKPNENRSPSVQNQSTRNNWKNENETTSRSNVLGKENINDAMENIKFSQKAEHFKRIELSLDKPTQVVVSFVNSDDKCWIYRKADKDKLEQLLFRVNIAGSKAPVIKPFVGLICASTYRGAWYRAIVREITPSIKVEYLDFGNFNDEAIKDVRKLPGDILNEPVLAVQLKFAKKPDTTLQDSVELKITALKKNEDGSYLVEEIVDNERIVKKERSVEKERTNLNTLEPHPAGKAFKSNSSDAKGSKPSSRNEMANGITTPRSQTPKPPVQTDIRSSSALSTNSHKSVDSLTNRVTNLSLKEKLQKMKETVSLNPTSRKSLVDIFETDCGNLQFIKRLDTGSCLTFVMSQKFLDELTTLEEITGDSNVTGKIGDTVSVQKDESWVRGTIVNVRNNQYTVALVDYAEIISTDKVCQLEKRFLDIPEFSCVCIGKVECIDLLEKKVNWDFTSSENNKMQLGVNDVFYTLTCKRWDPFLTNEQVSNESNETESDPVYTTAPPFKKLADGERVLPVMLNEGKFFVRNKDTNSLLKEITKQILDCKPSALTQEPILNQLVLCPHDTQTNLCRGIIRAVNNNYADVEFIDYGFIDTVPLKNLKNITASLASEYSSLIPITLTGYEAGDYPTEASECIESYCKSGTKFQAKNSGDNTFDLITMEGKQQISLSSKFKCLSATNDIIKYTNMAKYTIPEGSSTTLLCVSLEEDGSILCISTDDMQISFCELTEKIGKYGQDTKESYSPELDEVCLAKLDGEWYRGRVSEINTAVEEYKICFIDYGNVSTINSTDIRKIPIEFTKLPALAVACRLADVPNGAYTQEIIEAIKDVITLGNCYDVEVVRNVEDNIYLVKIAEVTERLLQCVDF